MRIAERISDLLRPQAFVHPARDARLIETHVSWVILAGNYAYKLRKPVNFGFLDFSTLEQRRADCEAEVRLNRRLCPDLYLGVVDVVDRDGRLALTGPGKPVEPAVWMRRLPDAGMLPALVERGAVDERLMVRLAKLLADFHASGATGPGVDEFGSVTAVGTNWTENFAQVAPFADRVISRDILERIRRYVVTFLADNEDLLKRRVRERRIRDGHGDLHAGSVCATRRHLYLFDCIEFNDRFRCADVAADVAFLAMDLEHLGRADLSTAFVDTYVRRGGDRELLTLVDFYRCYRAFVRGKVLAFQLDEPGLQPTDIEGITGEARAYFDLAAAYAQRPAQPILLVTMGLPASGKSTLARALASRCGLVHLSSDIVRKQLVGVRPTTHRLEGFERGLYGRWMTRRTYALLKRKAARWLRRGQSVVLDAAFGQPAERAVLHLLARRTGARLIFVLCRADDAVIQARLSARAFDTSTTSDARLELWPALRAAFVEPVEVTETLGVDTSGPLALAVEQVLAALRSSKPEPGVSRAA